MSKQNIKNTKPAKLFPGTPPEIEKRMREIIYDKRALESLSVIDLSCIPIEDFDNFERLYRKEKSDRILTSNWLSRVLFQYRNYIVNPDEDWKPKGLYRVGGRQMFQVKNYFILK